MLFVPFVSTLEYIMSIGRVNRVSHPLAALLYFLCLEHPASILA